MFAVGAGDQLVGVTEFCKYPPAAQTKPQVGTIISPDLERILAQEPDLILVAHGLDVQLLHRIRELGLPVSASDPTSLAETLSLIQEVGDMTGHTEEAQTLVAGLRDRQARVAEDATIAPEARPRVLVLLYWDGLWVGGTDSFIDDMITQAGGVNAVAFMPLLQREGWLQINREALVEGAPDVIVVAGEEAAPPGDTSLRGRFQQDSVWAELPAVRSGRVFVGNRDALTIPGPRSWDGLEAMAQFLHQTGTPPEAASGR
jgi:iron complex transport system substrate-binding protein